MERYHTTFIGNYEVSGYLAESFTEEQPSYFEFLRNVENRCLFLIEPSNSKICGVIISDLSPFSHLANVLRIVAKNAPVPFTAIIGVERKFLPTVNGHNISCQINPFKRELIIDAEIYRLDAPSEKFLGDAISIPLNGENIICLRPGYFYNEELAAIIKLGYNKIFNEISPGSAAIIVDKKGQIWLKASPIIYPSLIADYSEREFTNYMIGYTSILKQIYQHINDEENYLLSSLLIKHYYYSPVATFTTQRFATRLSNLKHQESNNLIETISDLAAQTSPLANPDVTIPYALSILKEELEENGPIELNALLYNKEQQDLIKALYISLRISDLRRAVIDKLRKENSWFASITKHRDKSLSKKAK